MQFSGTLQPLGIDINRYVETLDKALFGILEEGARIWIGAALENIPVWSGASWRTFSDLASAVNYTLTINPRPGSFQTSPKSFDVGRIVRDKRNFNWFFEYGTNLAHLVYNEYHDANISPDPGLFSRLVRPGPYNFQEKAAKAFEDYVSGQAISIPLPRIIRRRPINI